jgi:hypothetical protein
MKRAFWTARAAWAAISPSSGRRPWSTGCDVGAEHGQDAEGLAGDGERREDDRADVPLLEGVALAAGERPALPDRVDRRSPLHGGPHALPDAES